MTARKYAPFCSYPGCQEPHSCKGYCGPHYDRWRRGTDMDAPLRKYGETEHDRFWEKVVKTETCWEWRGATNRGYGSFRSEARTVLAHRFAFKEANGEIPVGMEVDHTCFNKRCVNPAHLRLLSHTENGQNRASANTNSKSGIRGVYQPTGLDVWLARGVLSGVTHEIGRFETKEDAARAATEWRAEYMPASILDTKKAA